MKIRVFLDHKKIAAVVMAAACAVLAPAVSASAVSMEAPGTASNGPLGPLGPLDPTGSVVYAESTPVTGQETPLFDGGSLTMLHGQSGAQRLSILFQSKEGGLVVVDGGWDADADVVMTAIREMGGHVHAWLITHPDSDHMGALSEILGRAGTGIVIDHIYCCLTDIAWYYKADAGEAPFVEIFKQRLAQQPSGVVVDHVSAGYQISVPGIEIKVLNNALFSTESPNVNNSSVVYRAEMNGVRLIFLGDMGEPAGDLLLQNVPGEELKADIVQMAHHGQAGVGKNVYQAISPSICLWPTPEWLWDNDDGHGFGSGSWQTLETRKWIRELGVSRNYVMKNRDITLK